MVGSALSMMNEPSLITAVRPSQPLLVASPDPACESCSGETRAVVYGADPDGFVLCRACRVPLYYCDIGGEG